jgi:large subunit ribosomal protein L13Ae
MQQLVHSHVSRLTRYVSRLSMPITSYLPGNIKAQDGGFTRQLVIDAKGHLRGRLAALVAKKLLHGQHIVVVRCELMNISGSLYRNKLKFMSFRRKRMHTNPKKGPFHYKQPGRMFWRTVRGMLPHKIYRGRQALKKLHVYEGIPPRFHARKRMLIPRAMTHIRLEPGRKFCTLGALAKEVGWNYKQVVEDLEVKRKVQSSLYWEKKQQRLALREKAIQATRAENAETVKILENFGITPR